MKWLYQYKNLIDTVTEQRKRMIKAVRYCLTLLTALLILTTPTNSKVSDSVVYVQEPAPLTLSRVRVLLQELELEF